MNAIEVEIADNGQIRIVQNKTKCDEKSVFLTLNQIDLVCEMIQQEKKKLEEQLRSFG